MTERTFYSHSLQKARKDALEFVDTLEVDQLVAMRTGRGHPTKGDVRYVTVEFSGDDPLSVNAKELKEADIKDQSHADLLKRYANLSQENLRLKMELAERKCAVIALQSLLNVHLKDISAALKKTGDA